MGRDAQAAYQNDLLKAYIQMRTDFHEAIQTSGENYPTVQMRQIQHQCNHRHYQQDGGYCTVSPDSSIHELHFSAILSLPTKPKYSF
jgi:hypothetical protein